MSRLLVVVLMAGLAIGLAAPVVAQTQEPGPGEVMHSLYDALNAKDLDSAMTYVADDAVLVLLPPPPGDTGVYVGKEAMRQWWETFTGRNGIVEFTSMDEHGNRVAWTTETTEDVFDMLGVSPIRFEGVGIVENGLLQSHIWKMTDESLARMAAAEIRMANANLADRYMQDLWNEGNVEVADEILAEDFVDLTPRPEMDPTREGLKADIAGFHEHYAGSVYFRVDDTVIDEDSVLIYVTSMAKDDGGAETEQYKAMILLGIEDGVIKERSTALVGWD